MKLIIELDEDTVKKFKAREFTYIDVMLVENAINNSEIVTDGVSVKVGHWERVYEDTDLGKFEAKNKACSVCGHPEKYIVAPYCRWCGAKMEGIK